MNVFRKLWNALDNLAEAIGHLSQTVFAISGDLRQRAGIEGPPALPVLHHPALSEAAGHGNGQVEPVKTRNRK